MDLHLEFFDSEIELRNPSEFPLRGPFRGHDGVRKWAREIWEVFTDLHNEIEEIVEVDDETVVSVQRTHARMRHQLPRIQSGRPYGDSGRKGLAGRGRLDPNGGPRSRRA